MLEIIGTLAIGLVLMLGGCTIVAVLGAGRGDLRADELAAQDEAPLAHPVIWPKAS